MPYESDTQNSGFPFYLSPQQQQVLLQALSGQSDLPGQNKDAPRPPTSDGAFMSSTSIEASPEQQNLMFGDMPGTSYLDGYDVDFGADSSFGDFDVSNISNVVAEDGNASAKSETQENESPEKRAREDEGDASGNPSNDAKRRENGEKVPKKPGRKPLTSEPTSKRKAQNRAAQRAFRERKEKHLRDLETKVVELEKKSADATSENTNLRKQLEAVTAELNEYKRRVRLLNPSRSISGSRAPVGTGNQGLQDLNNIDFQFEFPKFGYLPGPPQNNNNSSSNNNNKHGAQKSLSSSPTNPSLNVPNSNNQNQSTQNSAAKSNGFANTNDVNRSPQSQYDLSSGFSMSRTSLDSGHYSIGSTTTGSPSGSSQSNVGTSSSCGTSPEPHNQSPMGFKPVDTMTTIGEEQPSMSMTNNGQAGHFADLSTDFSFDWLAQQNGGQFDPQLFGDYREPQNNILNFEDSFFSDALDADFLTPYNLPSNHQTPAAKNLIAQINEQQEAVEPPVKEPPVKSEPSDKEGIDCFDVWSKIQSCDKVQTGGFDLDSLCAELQSKAKCGGDGPVIQEQEFQTTLRKYLGDEFMTKCGRHVVDEYRREGRQSHGELPKGPQKA